MESNKLVAISGVAKFLRRREVTAAKSEAQFQSITNNRYFAGLWEKDIVH